MSPLVLAMPGAEAQASRLAGALGAEQALVAVRPFPDGESLVRLEADPAGRDVVLVAALREPDPRFLPLAFAADAARELAARRVVLVAPYLPYLRQDTRFRPGEAVSSRTFARLLSGLVDGLVTVDPHLHRIPALEQVYAIPTRVVPAAPALAAWLRAEVPQAALIGPDAESEQWVAHVARLAGAPWTVLEKTRTGDRAVALRGLERLDGLAGRTPVLVDDIVSSAATLIEACRALRAAGAPPPVCLAVHALFAGDALAALRAAGPARVVTTDTVPHETNGIELTAELARAAAELLVAPV